MIGKFATIAAAGVFVVADILSLAAASQTVHARRADPVPSVDLGYEVHTGTINETGKYYLFSNIPYAEQPIGERRFLPPILPTGSSSTINNGSQNVVCYQAASAAQLQQRAQLMNVSLAAVTNAFYNSQGQTESCLALDVYVPEAVFDCRNISLVPVVVWIHGGGFIAGSKAGSFNPSGLLSRSMLDDNAGIVWVSINYRLGMFGWLGGAFDSKANLGLYDQEMALSWVQKYIALFGGDSSRVTVMGQSAGASSILHHITAYGGATAANFTQAIMQSPAYEFDKNETATYLTVMAEASRETNISVSDMATLANLDTATLKAINAAVTYKASTSYTFGPVPDGDYVPAHPQALLAEGKFNPDVLVMAGHNTNESLAVLNNVTNTSEVTFLVDQLLPGVSNETKSYITSVLYPESDYPNELLRAAQIADDAGYSCSTRYLGVAFGNATYNYIFAMPPAYHAGDLPYTFYNGYTSSLDNGFPVNETMAHALQDYILGFVLAGNPNRSPAKQVSGFPKYGSDAQVRAFTADGLVTEVDDMANVRCAWWQQAFVEGLVDPN